MGRRVRQAIIQAAWHDHGHIRLSRSSRENGNHVDKEAHSDRDGHDVALYRRLAGMARTASDYSVPADRERDGYDRACGAGDEAAASGYGADLVRPRQYLPAVSSHP